MTAGVFGYTDTFSLRLIDFDFATWHNLEYANWRALDTLLNQIYSISEFRGVWENSTVYAVGDIVIDGDVGGMYLCDVGNTSDASASFATERTNNPTYWSTYSSSVMATAGLPSPAVANTYLRRNGANTTYEAKTAAQVIAEILPITTRGDLIRGSATAVPERLAKGARGAVLITDANDTVWLAKGSTGALLYSDANDSKFTAAPAKNNIPSFDGADVVWRPEFSNQLAINGGFTEWSGVSSLTSVNTNLTYVFDIWYLMNQGNSSGATFTISRETTGGPDTNVPWLKALVTTADATVGAGDAVAIAQHITGYDSWAAADNDNGGSKALSVQFKIIAHADAASSLTFPATASFFVYKPQGGRGYCIDFEITSADTWQTIDLVIPADNVGNLNIDTAAGLRWGVTMICGSTYTEATAAWRSTGDFAIDTIDNFVDATNNYIGLAQFSMRVGTQEHDFMARTREEEINAIRPYFERIDLDGAGDQPLGLGIATGTNTGSLLLTYHPKRTASPTFAYSNADTFDVIHNGTSYNANGRTAARIGRQACNVDFTVTGTPFTVGDLVRVQRDGTDTAYIEIRDRL